MAGQHLVQASSDIFLGWLRAKYVVAGIDDHYYVRQLRDWKVSVDLEEMRPESMNIYGRLCGWTLARAHARSGDRHAIVAYLGKSPTFANAVGEFADACTPARTSATMPRSPKRSRMGASPHDAGCSPRLGALNPALATVRCGQRVRATAR